MKNSRWRASRTKTALVVVDIQERLLPSMCEPDRVLRNSLKLVKGAQVLGLPIVLTEQYRKGLGATVAEIAQAVAGFSPLEKLSFSACNADGWETAAGSRGWSDIILCGIEAHVCVTQTCLDLLESGHRVFVAADATSSRTAENHRLGIERMRDAGAIIVSTEMILFDLLKRAGTDEFKGILGIVK